MFWKDCTKFRVEISKHSNTEGNSFRNYILWATIYILVRLIIGLITGVLYWLFICVSKSVADR